MHCFVLPIYYTLTWADTAPDHKALQEKLTGSDAPRKMAEESPKRGTILPESGKRNILITSALPYVNNMPHLHRVNAFSRCVFKILQRARYQHPLCLRWVIYAALLTVLSFLKRSVTIQNETSILNPFQNHCRWPFFPLRYKWVWHNIRDKSPCREMHLAAALWQISRHSRRSIQLVQYQFWYFWPHNHQASDRYHSRHLSQA